MKQALQLALLAAASCLDMAVAQPWHNATTYGRLDLAEVCCTADSELSHKVISAGGTAERYSHWNGYDLSTAAGTVKLKQDLDHRRPRVVWMSPPCGPDSPVQNANQKTEQQRWDLARKQHRAHRIQRNIRKIFRLAS